MDPNYQQQPVSYQTETYQTLNEPGEYQTRDVLQGEPNPVLKYLVATLSIIIILCSILTFVGDIFRVWTAFASGLDFQAGFPFVAMMILTILVVSALLGFIGSCIVNDLHEKFVYIRMYIIGSAVYVIFSLILNIISSLFTLQHPAGSTVGVLLGIVIGSACFIGCCAVCMGISTFYAYSINNLLPRENKSFIEKIKDTTKKEKILAIVLLIALLLIAVVFTICFIIAFAGVFTPKNVFLQKYKSNNCNGPMVEGSGRAPINVCRSTPGGSSEFISYSNSGGKRMIKVDSFMDGQCKTRLISLDIEEKKCYNSGSESLFISLY